MLSNANWITAPVDMGVAACTFKNAVKLHGEVAKATLFASAMGVYYVTVDGGRVGDAVLAPGFTSYKNRVLYQTYDVTDNISDGCALEISVGQGWAVGRIGYKNLNHFFFDVTAAIARLEIEYTDGKVENLYTGTDWQVFTHPVSSTEIYHGETNDATHTPTLLGNAKTVDISYPLVPQDGEWIREHERLAAVEVIKTPKGETVIDFGQNMTGYVEIHAHGKRGERIKIHHAEVLDQDGNFYTANLRAARNENVYILSGEDEYFKPLFTFQGFRYIRLTEYPDYEVCPEDFTAIAVYSDMKRTGRFVCGNDKVNQLYHNIIWGQRSNFLDIPTDCPQRDERLGWTGDAQVFSRTATINYNTKKFFTKWLRDVSAEQEDNGAVWGIVPQCLGAGAVTRISAAWGDVATTIPWELYLAYGDKELLRSHLPMMKKWVEYMHSTGPSEYLWLTGYHYGDWLAMDAGEDSYVGATSCDLIASAFFAHSTSLVIKAGRALGEDVSEYEELYKNVRAAFREYFMENGMPKEDLPRTEISLEGKTSVVDRLHKGMTQTAITLILHFGLCDDSERAALTEKLVSLIKENGGKMSTGFVGTPYILHALTENGRNDVAYELLMKEENPSWLYSVCHGATTMWEHWNSIKEDGSFWSVSMNSFNHYAYGAVFDWIFGAAVGIKPDEAHVGYRHVNIAPHPSKELGFADASIETEYGKVRVHWYYKGDKVYYEISIPEGATATLTLPCGKVAELGAGEHLFA